MNNDMNNNQNVNSTNEQNEQLIINNQQPQQPMPTQEQQPNPVEQPMPVQQPESTPTVAPQTQTPVQQPVVDNKINKNAIFSVICVAISYFWFWWLASIGVALGMQAYREIKAGKGKGLVIAIIGVVVGTLFLGIYFVAKIMEIMNK